MSRTTAIGRRFLLAAMALSLCAIADRAPAQEDLAPAKTAIVQLKQLPGSVQRVVAVIRTTNFGPFSIHGSCGYDSHWYCFGDCKEFHWSWTFPGFAWLKEGLEQRYNNVANVAGQFDPNFAPVKNWLITTMPRFVTYLDGASKEMLANEQIVLSATASAEQKDAATKAIQSRFADIGTRLDEGSDQLRAGVVQLSNYNNQLNGALGQINAARQQMEQRFNSDTAQMNQKLGSYPCGDGDARNQYNGVKGTVTNQFNQVVSAAEQVGVVSGQTDKAVSLILGTVVNLRSRYHGIQQNLQAAKITPAGAVQALRLQVTVNSWQDFANFARQQLQ